MTPDFDIKLSGPGFPVETAGDQDLIFSGRFPTLLEEKKGLFNVGQLNGGSGKYIKVYEHSLKYCPFFLVFDSQGQFTLGGDWLVDEQFIYRQEPFIPTTGIYQWVIYRLNIFNPYVAPVLDTNFLAGGAPDKQWGIKASKRGKDVSSDDLRDFTLHSRARSPLIHQVDVKSWKTGDTVHTTRRTLPYNPIAFAFSKLATPFSGVVGASNLISGGQASPRLTRDATSGDISIASNSTTSQQTSVVIFKDPILAPRTIQVNY